MDNNLISTADAADLFNIDPLEFRKLMEREAIQPHPITENGLSRAGWPLSEIVALKEAKEKIKQMNTDSRENARKGYQEYLQRWKAEASKHTKEDFNRGIVVNNSIRKFLYNGKKFEKIRDARLAATNTEKKFQKELDAAQTKFIKLSDTLELPPLPSEPTDVISIMQEHNHKLAAKLTEIDAENQHYIRLHAQQSENLMKEYEEKRKLINKLMWHRIGTTISLGALITTLVIVFAT